MTRTTRSSGKKRTSKYVDYSSTDVEEDLDDFTDSEEEVKPVKKPTTSRVPKKKVKRTTEERIKEVVGDDSQAIEEEENNEMADEGEESTANINTKRLLDARSKKAKRMDWEQGFFYLPKFDCYLPRHILHMILEYVPPFPYFLNIRSTSQQWLDDFDTVICQNVKELDLVQRNDIDYEPIRYKYPWYDATCSTRRNNDCIRFLAILFPNIEKLILPAIGANVRVPQNILKLFHKLENMEIFYVCPITLDVSYTAAELPLTYRQDITNIQSITYGKYLTQFTSSLVMVKDDISTLVTLSNALLPDKVVELFNYFVKKQHFSLKRLNVLSLPENVYSDTLIDFILEENVKHVQRGYGTPELTPQSHSLYITNDAISDYMLEKQFFKTLLSPQEISSYNWEFISQILTSVTNVKIFKMLFEQANLPLVFDNEINPLLWLLRHNTSPTLPEIVEFLCALNPSLTTLGNEDGVVDGDEKKANILRLYITHANDIHDYNHCEEKVISTLIKIGCDTKYVCPTTGNNLIHIHPCSPSLIDSLPAEFIQMKNNKGFNPFERLMKRVEFENNIRPDQLVESVDAFGKAYSKHNISINDLRFEKNQNLIHKFIKLSKPQLTRVLIKHGVDSNSIDEDGNLPIMYYLDDGVRSSDEDMSALINSISDETLTKQFHNKSLLANIIERVRLDDSHHHHYYNYGFNSNTLSSLNVVESLLSRGCNLNEAIIELSSDFYQKGNLELNTSVCIIQLLHAISGSSIETLKKIFKYFTNFEQLLVKPITLRDTQISPLLFLVTLWKKFRSNRQSEIFSTFFTDDPLIPSDLLQNIIEIPNKKVDVLYYTIVSCNQIINWQYIEGILGIKYDLTQTGWWYRPTNFTEICSHFATYRYEDEFFGNLNIVQLATIMGADQILKQIEQAFVSTSSYPVLESLTNEPFKNGSSILDELAKKGLFNIGNMFLSKSQSNSLEWDVKHFRTAYESNQYEFCYNVICDEQSSFRKHDFTKEEMVKIIIGNLVEGKFGFHTKQGQLLLAENIEKLFGEMSPEERFKLFSKRFKIAVCNDEPKEGNHYFGLSGFNWQNFLEACISEAKSVWTKTHTTKPDQTEYYFSLLDTCYRRGSLYLLSYIVLQDTTGRKKKNILSHSELDQDILVEWLSSKCESTGQTLLHIACTELKKSRCDNYAHKLDLVDDVLKYFESIDREDIINIQDNEGRTPAFYAAESGNCIEKVFRASDLSIKNHKGETVYDLLNEEERKAYALFFEPKKKKAATDSSPKRANSTRKKKKVDTDDDEEEKPKAKKKSVVRRKKKKYDSEEDYNDEDNDEMIDDEEEKKKPSVVATESSRPKRSCTTKKKK